MPVRVQGVSIQIAVLASHTGEHAALVGIYADLSEPILARQSLTDAAKRFNALGLPSEKLRAEWALARLLVKQHLLREAATIFADVRDAFQSMQMTSEGILASLDLVECCLLLDDADVAYDECQKVVAALAASGLGTTVRARTAIALLREATAQRSATPSLIQNVRLHLDPIPPRRGVSDMPPTE